MEDASILPPSAPLCISPLKGPLKRSTTEDSMPCLVSASGRTCSMDDSMPLLLSPLPALKKYEDLMYGDSPTCVDQTETDGGDDDILMDDGNEDQEYVVKNIFAGLIEDNIRPNLLMDDIDNESARPLMEKALSCMSLTLTDDNAKATHSKYRRANSCDNLVTGIRKTTTQRLRRTTRKQQMARRSTLDNSDHGNNKNSTWNTTTASQRKPKPNNPFLSNMNINNNKNGNKNSTWDKKKKESNRSNQPVPTLTRNNTWDGGIVYRRRWDNSASASFSSKASQNRFASIVSRPPSMPKRHTEKNEDPTNNAAAPRINNTYDNAPVRPRRRSNNSVVPDAAPEPQHQQVNVHNKSEEACGGSFCDALPRESTRGSARSPGILLSDPFLEYEDLTESVLDDQADLSTLGDRSDTFLLDEEAGTKRFEPNESYSSVDKAPKLIVRTPTHCNVEQLEQPIILADDEEEKATSSSLLFSALSSSTTDKTTKSSLPMFITNERSSFSAMSPRSKAYGVARNARTKIRL